jgi:hypothetical protein
MGFLIDKILVTLFLLGLKTRRVVKSAISGKLNYKAKIVAPYLVGALLVAWLVFIYSL